MEAVTQELEGTEAELPTQFLTFIMANEEYGVDILSVQEIRGWEAATPLPNAPDYVRGVMNLRGTIVPIIDLRMRFGIPKADYGPLTVIIVLKIDTEKGEKIIGIVVDAVSDVYTLNVDDLKDAPEIGSDLDRSYIKGLVTVAEKMVILLNTDSLLSGSVEKAIEAGSDSANQSIDDE